MEIRDVVFFSKNTAVQKSTVQEGGCAKKKLKIKV